MTVQPIPATGAPVQAQFPPRFNIVHLPTEGMVQHSALMDAFAEVLAPFAELGRVIQKTHECDEEGALYQLGSLLQRMETTAYLHAEHKLDSFMPAEVVNHER